MIDVTMSVTDTFSKIYVDVGDVGVEDSVSDGRGNTATALLTVCWHNRIICSLLLSIAIKYSRSFFKSIHFAFVWADFFIKSTQLLDTLGLWQCLKSVCESFD